MNRQLSLLGGIGLGAALMYMVDPDRGKRRRALVRDKLLVRSTRSLTQSAPPRETLRIVCED